ncbi:hypothetical protein CLPU_2c00060 [Gottschalkia purinilytica]|uniref:Uncharacterized protein n=1 Tax=Gottschalkia purinilytica TaxID=1503 RepID=A0A0L0WDR3_GOTPU|nr:hypothetical protein [Gottschalkia purinilytica]KNF09555.1 hypothetical protein CLPU_2c00060 [Gottschalkia purinilytica]
MKVFILDKEFEVYNNENIIGELENIVKDTTIGTDYSFSHMIINGENIYDHDTYITSNYKDIKEIKIIVKTESDLIKDTLSSVHDDIDNIIHFVKQISEDFAKKPDRNAFMDLIPLFDRFNFIFNSFNSIETSGNLNNKIANYEAWNEYAKEVYNLSETMRSFQIIMRDNDVLAISDALVSKVVPILEVMKVKISSLL